MKQTILTLALICTGFLRLFGNTEEPDIFSAFLLKTGHTSAINSATRQNDTLITSSSDKTVKLWDLTTGELRESYSFKQKITTAVLTEDGRNILATDTSERIFKVDAASGLTVGESKEKFTSHFSKCRSFLWGENLILINNKIVLALNTESLEKAWFVEFDKVLPETWGYDWNVTRNGDRLLFTDGRSMGWIYLSDGTVDAADLSMDGLDYTDYLWPLDTERVLNNEYSDMFYYSAGESGLTRFSDIRGEIFYTGGTFFAVKNTAIHLFSKDLKELNTLNPEISETESLKIFFPDETSLAVTSPRGDLYYYADFAQQDALVLGNRKITPSDLMVRAARKGQFVTAEEGGYMVRSWQTSTGAPRRIYESDEPVSFLSLNATEDTLFVGTKNSLRAVSLSSMSEKSRRKAVGEVLGMAYSQTLDALVSYEYTNSEQSLKIWHWKKKDSTIETIPVEKGYRNDYLISLDESHMLLTDGNDFYECYDLTSQTREWEIKESVNTKRDVYYGMEEGKFLLIKADGKIYRETSQGVMTESADLGNYGYHSFLISADVSEEASVLAAGTSDGKLLYFDWNSLDLEHAIDTGDHLISNLFITDKHYGRQLLFTNDTGALCLWTRINDKWKYLTYPLNESALILKPSRGEAIPRFYGEIKEEDNLFLARTRVVPGIGESRWEFLNDEGEKTLRILCKTENIPDRTVLRVQINQCNSCGDFIKEVEPNLTCLVSDGTAEISWKVTDTRDPNEISDLWFSYRIESSYSSPVVGDPIRVTYPEIQDSFWYNDGAAAGEPAVLSLVVRDLDPKEGVSLEFFETSDRVTASALMEGFRIGEMEDPIVINNQRFSHAGLKKGTSYYITLHTAEGLKYNVIEPVSYQ